MRLHRARTGFIKLKIIGLILVFNLISGCYNFFKVSTISSVQPSVVSPLVDMSKTFVVHSGTDVFLINSVSLVNDTLRGSYVGRYIFPFKKDKFPVENSTNRYVKKKGDARLINEIHLYIRNNHQPTDNKVSFALKDISRLDIYNHAGDRTAISWIFGLAVGVLAAYMAFFLILILVMALSGGSCPYIYVNTGDGYAFTGEIYSGAVYAPLERSDYLTLPQLVAENGNYKLKISNELEEVQYTNLTELIVIDHPANSDVVLDKYGNYQTAVKLSSPLTAINFLNTDILTSIKGKDSLSYLGVLSDKEFPLTDGIIMTFDHPEGVESGKLFLRAKNSLWLDYVYKKSHDLFGGSYDLWTKKQNKSDTEQLRDWPLSQKIPLSVFVEKNGEWVFCDYFNMAGPAALREDVIVIDLKGTDSGPLKIKLESGSHFWEIDYAGLDFSSNVPVDMKTVKIEKAITNDEVDVTGMLKYDDLKYYIQPATYNIADLSFPAPPPADSKRTVFLHSKGYYNIINEAGGLPKIKKLKTIREPGQFLEYSRELMKAEIDKISRYQ